MRMLMIGCGNMGGAMLTAWLQADIVKEVSIVSPSGSPKFKNHNKVIAYTSVDAIDANTIYDVIMIAVKPQMLDDVLPAYTRFVSDKTIFVTMAAGKSISYYENILGNTIPFIRIMPNTPSALGQGVTLITGNHYVSDENMQSICNLLSANGSVEILDNENILDKATTISGCGPAYVALFIESLTNAGISIGLQADLAERLAIKTVIGSGIMLDNTPLPIETQRENVTSKGGVTAAALDIMMRNENGMKNIIEQALNNAMKRTAELKQ